MIIRRTDVNLQKSVVNLKVNMGMDTELHLSKLNLELLPSRMSTEQVQGHQQSSRVSRRL